MYTFHRISIAFFYLKCTDKYYNGTTKYNMLSGIITENNLYSIENENHSYVKESIIKKIE